MDEGTREVEGGLTMWIYDGDIEELRRKEIEIKKSVKEKTNEENLKCLSGEALAWFLGNYSDDCRTCVYKDYETCSETSCHV